MTEQSTVAPAGSASPPVPGRVALWVDGRLVASDQPALRADDHALVGDGAFEAIKVVEGRPFALTRHLVRLRRSLQPLGIELDEDAVRNAVTTLMSTPQAAVSPSWLRITVTGGSAPMGTGAVGGSPTIVGAVAPMAAWPPTTTVVIAPWVRNERGPTTGLKTISYADNVIAHRYAHAQGADEAVFANTRGDLCEGTGSNVVLAVDGRLVTPTLASGCLAGVTRELLLEWLPEIEERDVAIDALAEASEAFLTSTSRSVHPIRRVGTRELAAAPGSLTRRAIEIWNERSAREIDP
ncbi:MAG TPA: aminotransferase class IV [Ilumatobacter sp.]|jgi:branched-chain amino acid aminotransferase|nr:aminotransferase class IV [Ilumatobacter sp.]